MLSRKEFFQALSEQIARGGQEGTQVGVILARVQRLGETNLILSDPLIQAARTRIEQALRPEDRVAQIGECDFAIFLPGIRGGAHASLAANRLVRVYKEPLAVDGRPVQATIVMGVSVCPDHGSTPEALCRHAEIAFADALQISDRYSIYSSHEDQLEIRYADLHEAIVNNRLAVHLQAIWDLRLDRMAGAESLARWVSPLLGPVPPDQFIPFAEQTGLIADLTRWSVNATLRYSALARRGGAELPMAINLSARVFHVQGVVEQILGALKIWDVSPQAVILEVTENAIMADPQLSARVLERLRSEGLRISIDDFGSGYSSFRYLQQFSATELKIDKSFVMDMRRDERAGRLVRSMIDLAHHLNIHAIAEGVESPETAALLTEMDCDYAQGYCYGAPQPADDFIAAYVARATV